MVNYHQYAGGRDLVTILEHSATRPRVKVINHRTGKRYWVHTGHVVAVEKAVA